MSKFTPSHHVGVNLPPRRCEPSTVNRGVNLMVGGTESQEGGGLAGRGVNPVPPIPTNRVLFSIARQRDWAGVPPQTSFGRISRSTCRITGHYNHRKGGGVVCNPSPASHHDGVSGGVWNTRLTPAWCEVGRGGDRDE